MKKIILSFLFTFAFFQNINFGCSCLEPSSFCESITDNDGNVVPKYIVRGTVIEKSGDTKIKLDELIYGDLNLSELVIKWNFCTLYLNEVEEGEEYIFALSKDNDNNFYLLSCAISFLKIENELVKGKVAPGVESIDYKDMASLETCGNAFENIAFESSIIVFPNPTNGEIKIQNNSSNLFEHLELSIFDTVGRELSTFKKTAGILPEETWEINIQIFSAGIYIIKLSGKNQVRYIKILKYTH